MTPVSPLTERGFTYVRSVRELGAGNGPSFLLSRPEAVIDQYPTAGDCEPRSGLLLGDPRPIEQDADCVMGRGERLRIPGADHDTACNARLQGPLSASGNGRKRRGAHNTANIGAVFLCKLAAAQELALVG